MEIKNDFISNITHELKTPVSTVSVALEAMQRFQALDDPKKAGEYLTIAQHELNRLVLMTDKILQTASFETRGPEMETVTFDLETAVREVIQSMKLIFEKRNMRVAYETKGSGFFVKGSRSQLITVFCNLFDNAVKYSPESSAIIVTLDAGENDITISIKDNGAGIPVMYQKKVFEKFFRVPSGDVHNIKGYGLGLSYVASVVEGHKGEINLESETGKGSCFRIRLPKNAVL
jgi:signal transduction histidine kinase